MRIQSGSAENFRMVGCVRIEGADTASRLDVRRVIMRTLRSVGIDECTMPAAEGAQLRVFYQAGPGVCIDCAPSSDALRTGFALISVEENGSEKARAEWQYTSGGDAEAAASAFGHDLMRLLRGD
jgi:hypothetical protein